MVSAFFIRNRNAIIRIFILSLSFIVILILFPNERKFRYEFQEGAPWQHDNLLATFDFPIFKLPKEIQNEKDSIYQNLKLYFNYDITISEFLVNDFTNNFEKIWKEVVKEDSLKRKTIPTYRYKPYPNKSEYLNYLNEIITNFVYIYNKGVFDPSDVLTFTESNDFILVFLKDNFVKTYTRYQVFTLKTGYEYIDNKTNKIIEKASNKDLILVFLKNLAYDKNISKNLFFDVEKTKEIRDLAVNNLSNTIGFMQAGELIISKGEIVSVEKYRILLSLKNEYEQTKDKISLFFILFGDALVLFILLGSLLVYLKKHQKDLYENIKAIWLIYFLITLFVSLISLVEKYNLFNVYIFPLALLPLVIKTFFDERLSLFVLLVAIAILGFIVPNGFEFIIIQFITSFAAVMGLTKMTRRGQLFATSGIVFATMSVIYFSFAIVQEAIITKISGVYFLYFAMNSLLLMSAYPLIYGLERLFGFVSDITLLEYSNTNHPLLQKLASVAPGSFQHSIQVANLAESAANKIGANSLLVKVAAMYHDIGKTKNPVFFSENQVTGFNPHDQIEFDQSAKIIINHVAQGITLATKHKLPQQIIDFIRTHHGTTTVQYFHKNYVKKYPEKKDEIEKFTYPGPKPFTKEMAILMMADATEAASRSLKEIDANKISELIEKIINYQMEMKQYENTDLTFKDILVIKDLFKELLINIYHARIEYPK